MGDIIKLLPDSIANQIAAGEVIQRPSSVIKELVENSLDAKATSIQIIIKDAGRTLIQVIDNGIGMSATDARMAFERHATSKIKTADDLFSLSTMGFRGEALPSIAAIAQISLKTRTAASELGTLIEMAGSKVEKQEMVACPVGSNIMVKNIFFNVPARRKFLKSNETERRNIINELERIVLVNPDVDFTLIDNDVEILNYPASNTKQRIINVAGKSFNNQLISIQIETALAKITGFIGKPESSRKARAQQYFFVNNRYMRHPYFGKAVTLAFDPLIPNGESPNYFIYFEVDPSTIDVNIHPTKTEIKFENEQPLWQILSATVKEALGKFNEIPSIDFDMEGSIEIPIHDANKSFEQPQIKIDKNYNPFKEGSSRSVQYQRPQHDWEKLFENFQNESGEKQTRPITFDDIAETAETNEMQNRQVSEQIATKLSEAFGADTTDRFTIHYQYKNKYILTSAKSGLMFIDQHRAHVRILFEQFLQNIQHKKGIAQRVLFPEIIEFSASESLIIEVLQDDLEALGFELSNLGNNAYTINSIPSEITNCNPVELIKRIVNNHIEHTTDVHEEIREAIALSMAYSSAIPYGQSLNSEEMTKLINQLFSLSSHKYTPDGKTIISMLEDQTIEKMFK